MPDGRSLGLEPDAGDGLVPGGSDSLVLGSGDGLEPGGDGLGPGGGLGPDHPARAPWPSGYQRLSETPVGQGVVSRVFGAIREYTGEVVAVKVHPDLPNSSALREVMAFRQLQAVPSPHCLSMLGQIVAGPALFTVHPLFASDLMTIVKGPRVQAGLADRGYLLSLCRGVCTGVAHLHSLGVVHGNLSLENVLVCGRLAAIGDFGAAHVPGGPLTPDTDESAPYIRAPERIFGGEPVTQAADVWAAGVLAMALATGRVPWFRPGATIRAEAAAVVGHTALLGPPAASWPEVVEAPRWENFRDLATGPDPGPVDEVIRCMPASGPLRPGDMLVEVAAAFLKWPPWDRLDAAGAARALGGPLAAPAPSSAATTCSQDGQDGSALVAQHPAGEELPGPAPAPPGRPTAAPGGPEPQEVPCAPGPQAPALSDGLVPYGLVPHTAAPAASDGLVLAAPAPEPNASGPGSCAGPPGSPGVGYS